MSVQDIQQYLENFISPVSNSKTRLEFYTLGNITIPRYINDYWTSQQRQGNSLHEISYRACFKPQLPNFFIQLLSKPGDTIYDPFSGRGTTAIEAFLNNRQVVANDINPLSLILLKPRLNPPAVEAIEQRLETIDLTKKQEPDIDLSMFYNPQTLSEILALKAYLQQREKNAEMDIVDEWIRMVATNRLTGHSKGFFSVYTLPPNQAVKPERQIKINEKYQPSFEYKAIKPIILNKSHQLQKDIKSNLIVQNQKTSTQPLLLNNSADATNSIAPESIQLTITSPPFLDIVQYADDNWLRCWFNGIDAKKVEQKIVMAKSIDEWRKFIKGVFLELFRITKPNGYVAFEVGEVRNGKIKLDEIVVEVGIEAGFYCIGILINQQIFTKTSNIWGIRNNQKGTNTNRIVLFQKV